MPLSFYIPSLLAAFAASFIAFVNPGPGFIGIVSSAVHNRVNGMIVAIGVGIGTGFWALMAVSGVTVLLTQYPKAAVFMQVVGGSYLGWLGAKSLGTAFAGKVSVMMSDKAAETSLRSLGKGLLIQLTNPLAAFFWLSMVSIVILPGTPLIIAIALVAGSTAISLAWHLLVATAFSLGKTRHLYMKASRSISAVFGIAFIALGLRLVLGTVGGL